jgi:hypothetical protein
MNYAIYYHISKELLYFISIELTWKYSKKREL